MRTYNHVGILTNEQKEGAMFNEGLNVWLTDYSKSPNKIELLPAACLIWLKRMVISLTRFLHWKKR